MGSFMLSQEQFTSNTRYMGSGQYDKLVGWEKLDDLNEGPDVHETSDGRLVEYDMAIGGGGYVARARVIGSEGIEAVAHARRSGSRVEGNMLKEELNGELKISLPKNISEPSEKS